MKGFNFFFFNFLEATKRGKFELDWDSCCERKNEHNRYNFNLRTYPLADIQHLLTWKGILVFNHLLLSFCGNI